MSELVTSTSGTVGPKSKRPENRRVSVRFQACAASVLLGWVASLVAVANGGGFVSAARPTQDQRPYQTDAWQIAAAIADLDGVHELPVRHSSSEGFVAGQSPHALTPNAHVRTIALMDDAQPAGFRLASVRAERTEWVSTPTRRFDRIAVAPGAGTAQDSQVAERSDDVLAPAWNWMRDANRSYHQNVVPRIKQHGAEGAPAETERARVNRSTDDRNGDVSRNLRDSQETDANTPWPTGTGYNLSEGISNWLAAARRGYGNEVVPRLRGLTPDVRIARPRDDAKDEETDAERRLRLERERSIGDAAARTAEQERLDAERRRLDAESRRKSVEAEAARIAGEHRRAEEEEALKLAEEKRRALERRAEEERVAAEEKRRREAQDQSDQARERDVAANREKEAEAERARQRVANRDRELETAEARRRRETTEAAENERKRRADEEARRAAERQRLEQEGRDRLIAQAEAIRRRQAAAELRAREEQIKREERQLEARSKRLARAEPKEERPRPQLPAKRPLAGPNEGSDRFVRRDTTIEFTTKPRAAPRVAPLKTAPRDAQPTPAATPPAPQRQTDRFARRNTTIDFAPTVRGRTSDASGSPARPDTTTSSVRLRSTRTASISKRIRRPGASDGRCRDRAGRLITPPGTYVVARGDSLWTISRRHYRHGRLFPKIYKANMAKIRRANQIFPCQRFHLPRK